MMNRNSNLIATKVTLLSYKYIGFLKNGMIKCKYELNFFPHNNLDSISKSVNLKYY